MATLYATTCPVCDGLIDFDETMLNMQVECPDCAEVFKIISLEPIKLAYAYDINHEPHYYDEDHPRS